MLEAKLQARYRAKILYVNKTPVMFLFTNSILLRHNHILNKMTLDKQNILFIMFINNFIKRKTKSLEVA